MNPLTDNFLKEIKSQPRILYPVRLSFRTEGEGNRFPDKHK